MLDFAPQGEWPLHISHNATTQLLDNFIDNKARLSFGHKVKPYYMNSMFQKGFGPLRKEIANMKGESFRMLAQAVGCCAGGRGI